MKLLIFPLLLLGLTQVVPPKARLTKNVVVVMDVSGSMTSSVKESVDVFRMITRQPIDEMELSIVAFASDHSRWDWHKLPSATALDEAERWVEEQRVVLGDSTKLLPALTTALKLTKDKLSIVVVSDGFFWFDRKTTEGALDIVRRLQTERQENGLSKAVICCVGVSGTPDGVNEEHLRTIAEYGEGGFYKWTP